MSRDSGNVGKKLVNTVALLAVAIAFAAPRAGAVELDGNRVDLTWVDASGPVGAYAVFVERNGSAPGEPEQTVNGNSVALFGNVGDVLVVRVAGLDAGGNEGPLSDASEIIEFVAAPPPPPPPAEEPPPPADEPPPAEDPGGPTQPVYFEDFESYLDGEDAEGWYDTMPRNGLTEDPTLFETFTLTDGTVAFGTSSTRANVHSHLALPGAADWSDYEVSGLMSIDHRRAGIGVTLYSDFPNSKRYYRLRRYRGERTFSLSLQADEPVSCVGAADTHVQPATGVWYRFRFQARAAGDGTRLLAKVWVDGGAEPEHWQVDCLDPSGTFRAGAPGVWSKGKGVKLWDDIAVAPVGELPVAPPIGASDEPAPGSDPGGLLYSENFEAYVDAVDPVGWLDTARDYSLSEAPHLFETFALTDGSVAFGTASLENDVHSHLVVAGSAEWSAYEFSGAMSTGHQGSDIGVTLYSDYPRSDGYYRLRHVVGSGGGGFHLAPQPGGVVRCQGATSTGVVPWPGIWYRFRFHAQPEGGAVRLRAKVWARGSSEPEDWQLDCLDPDATFEAGAPGVWSRGRGIKLWDDLEVRTLDD